MSSEPDSTDREGSPSLSTAPAYDRALSLLRAPDSDGPPSIVSIVLGRRSPPDFSELSEMNQNIYEGPTDRA